MFVLEKKEEEEEEREFVKDSHQISFIHQS
jgi:hypothetical protein